MQRRIALAAAVILGFLTLLYLGGFLGQMIAGYRVWLEGGGVTGNVAMPPIRAGPFECLSAAFTVEGLKAIAIIAGSVLGLVLFLKFQNRFSSKDQDDRNFIRSKSGAYGTAGWMTKKEMKKVLEVTTPEKARGVILGKKDGAVICLPHDTLLNKHLCVFGASGTMKSRAIVRPYLFQSMKRGESVLCTDVKGELYNDTAEMFRRKGYKVRVFNLINPEFSDSWNCMADLNGDTMTAQILTDIIISNTGGESADHFWDNGEGNLLKSLILYIDQDSTRSPDAKHLPAVYQMLTQNTEKSLSAIFDKLPISHPAKAPYNLFAQASDTVRAGIVLGLGTRLQVLQNEAIRHITSHNGLDLTEPGKTRCAYFVILSDQESSTEFISSLFFSLLFIRLTRYADSTPELRCKVPVNIVFEEFNNIGKLDSYPRRLSVLRSRRVQVLHVAQSLAQLRNRYPDDQWAEIVGNCDTQIMLGCTEDQTADYFSIRSGDMTVTVNSTMAVKQTITIAQMIPHYRESEGMGKRRLLTKDEIYRLPNDEMLIVIRGENVLRCNKFDFTGHPYAKHMVQSNIFNYKPGISQTEPGYAPDAKILTPPPQTEIKNHLDSGISSPDYNNQSQSGGGAGIHEDNNIQRPPSLPRTGHAKPGSRNGRRPPNSPPPPDYSKLLESFAPRPDKQPKQPKEAPPQETPAASPVETDAGQSADDALPAIAGLSLIQTDADYKSPALYGDATPPDDF